MSGEQVCQRRAGIGFSHEGFTDQEAVDASFAHADDVVRRADARFGDGHAPFGLDDRQKGQRGVKADVKGAEIAVVDADQGVVAAVVQHIAG